MFQEKVGHGARRSRLLRPLNTTAPMRTQDSDTSGVHIWLVLFRATRSVEGHALRNIESLGLCYSDFAVLEVLLHKGPMPINTLGRKVLLASGSMTPAVDRLERRGLVRRKDDPVDRRVRVVELTPPGEELIREAFAAHEDAMERAVSALTAAERATVVRLLKKLGKGAEAQQTEGDDEVDRERFSGGGRREGPPANPTELPANPTKARRR